jgi:hypothetical protein
MDVSRNTIELQDAGILFDEPVPPGRKAVLLKA